MSNCPSCGSSTVIPLSDKRIAMSFWRVAQALNFPCVTNTVGAPSFAHFAKGGNHSLRRKQDLDNLWIQMPDSVLIPL